MASIFTNPIEQFEPRARQFMDIHPQDDGTDDDNLASSILSSAPKLSAKSTSCTGNSIQIKNEELWTIREVWRVGEEELYAKGKCVYNTRNSLIIKSFNFTDHVVKLFWLKFGEADHICVALTSGLSIFDKLGQHFQIPLPFAYQDMYPSKMGLIIERNCDQSVDSTSLPTLFALTHPSKEISPVLFKANQIITYSMSNYMSIVSCHACLPICLIYNSQECQHSIWKIRRITDDEASKFQQMNEQQDSFTNTFTNQSFSFREGPSSINLSNKQRSNLMQSNQSNLSNSLNFSPKMDIKRKHSELGNLAASRLGTGAAPVSSETVMNSTNLRSFNSVHTMNMMSTPNRNKIINYLRDNIEEPILPEITLEQIWTEPSTNSPKSNKFFTTTDFIDNNYLVIVTTSSTQLKVIKMSDSASNRGDDIEFEFGRITYITAIDALPIPTMKMMIVLDGNKNFVLYSGCEKVTDVTVPAITRGYNVPCMSSPSSLKLSGDSPIQMSSARKRSSLGDRSTLSESSFQQMFQALSPVPHTKPDSKPMIAMAQSGIKQLEHVLGSTVYVLSNQLRRAKFKIPSVSGNACIGKLLDSMKVMVSKELSLNILSRWFQTRRSSEQAYLMHAADEMRLFKNWFINSIGVECNYFDFDLFEPMVRLVHLSPVKKSKRSREIESNPMLSNIYSLFYALHLVLEDLLLSKLNYDNASDLTELLLVLACILKLDQYQDYYWLKFPNLQEKFGRFKYLLENLIPKVDTLYKPPAFSKTPPSVADFANAIINKTRVADEDEYDEILRPFPYIKDVTDNLYIVISLFCELFGLNREKSIIPISSSMSSFPDRNILKEELKRSRDADRRVVELLVEFGKDKSYLSRLPGGLNLYMWDAILNCRECPPIDWNEACFDLIGRMDLVSLVRGDSTINHQQESDDETLKLIFPDDIRVSEAHRMLASNVQVEFSVTQRQGATEEESREEIHRQLCLLNVRTMAMSIGRGAIRLRTYSPVIGESFEVPKLELSGKALNEDRPIEYLHDTSVYPWPFFHNGVAAGLTICASTANNIIDSTWINYNRPRSNIPHSPDVRDRDLTATNINNEHAGFLFALGLNGHLEKLSLMALHDYLCQNNDLTKLAILLGMSAAKRGSKDNNIIKVLSIHVDALLPPNSTKLDVPAPIHAASIIGVGLLYQGSGDSHISKVLLEEIGRLPGPETNSHVDRESYSLSAGLSFGLVNLCKGGSTTITSSDQLRLYMLGGKRRMLSMVQTERYFKQDCHRGEEEYINTHITSPGGTLGLGLMYHRSGNQSVANWMKAPDTQTLLEYVRPDFLILRMLSYGLIMWNEIEPTEDWINLQIPKIISTHAFQRNSDSRRLVASAATNIDYELISQAYCNIVAGCCMAIAMRYAGTASKQAYETIYNHTKTLIVLSTKPSVAEQAGRPCVEACLNVLITSLAVVMAGTGDLGVMRVCRYLRSRLTPSCAFYGSYMAVHMALGILFLGSCRYSLSTSPESIGALVCALYPIYPNFSSCNRYHLQALRHLYALAAEPRLLIPRDILTNKPVYVNISIKLRKDDDSSNIELKLRAPCLMPEVDSIHSVYVNDDRYWRIEINNKDALKRCLFQDNGCLSVKQKAHSSNNQLVHDIERYILKSMPKGAANSRNSSALSGCVKEDRVEQYSAMNELLAKSRMKDVQYKNLLFEQIHLACTLADHDNSVTSKMNVFKPIIHEMHEEFSKHDIFNKWFDYLSKKTTWIDTHSIVANYISLNNFKCSDIDDELLKTLKDLTFHK